MTLGQEIEQIRRECNIPDYTVYDIFETDERGCREIINGHRSPSVYELIMFISTTCRPLDSLFQGRSGGK